MPYLGLQKSYVQKVKFNTMGKTNRRVVKDSSSGFLGEDSFVIKKGKSSKGRIDDEGFSMIVGDVKGIVPVYETTPIIPSETTPPVVIVPPVDTSAPPFNYEDSSTWDCVHLTAYLAMLEAYAPKLIYGSKEQSMRHALEMANVKSYMTKACAVKVQLPTFPDWSTLSCTDLQAQISAIEATLAVGKYAEEITIAYNNALTNAKFLFSTKCNVKTTTPVVLVPLPTGMGMPPVFGGGGGGGGTEDVVGVAEPKKANYSWLWILVAAGGLYYLSKKSKK